MANKYVRPSGGGGGGTSWTDAWNNFSGINWNNVGTSDTIWVAGGTYSAALTPGKSGASSTNRINIRRARADAPECTGAAGWSAAFNANVVQNLQSAYVGAYSNILVSGRTTAAGGTQGWVVRATGTGGYRIWNHNNDLGLTNNYYEYLDVGGPTATALGGDSRCFVLIGQGAGNVASHCLFHGCCSTTYVGWTPSFIMEYSEVYDCNPTDIGAEVHPQTLYTRGGSNCIIRYCKFYHSDGEGIAFSDLDVAGSDCNGWQIYGNLFYTNNLGGAAAAISFQGPYTMTGLKLYNNTFVNNGNNFKGLSTGIVFGTGCESRNNLIYGTGGSVNLGTSSNNITASSGGSFVSLAGLDFHLTSGSNARNAGTALTINGYYDKDRDGVTRGADGGWDAGAYEYVTAETLRYHTVVTDGSNKLLPWYSPNANAWDRYLYQLWQWLPTVPNYNGRPMYYLTCGFTPGSPITPQIYENDWGEKVPNIVEFARLYYAYGGGTGPMTVAKALMDYAIANGISAGASWPGIAYGTGVSGAATITGENNCWSAGNALVDLGADMGMAAYRLYQYDGTAAYRTLAINTADLLASKIVAGSSTNSPWPYVVATSSGSSQSRYTSNWAGALTLFDLLIEAGEPNAAAYTTARTTLKAWLLTYPMANGNWVSGHSDVPIDGNTNKCATTASNMALYLLDNPTFDPNHATDVPALLQWLETYMVAAADSAGTYNTTSGVYLGAHVPCEQTAFMRRMGYQAARLGAVYARWYRTSGNATHADIAYRNLNYNTYMMKSTGESSDGPTDEVGYWFGDCYGEAPRMYFHGMAGLPQYAPAGESHILYSRATLTSVSYGTGTVQYTAANPAGTEYLRCNFQPVTVTVAGVPLISGSGYSSTPLGGTDYAVSIFRTAPGAVVVSASGNPPSGPIRLSVE